MKAKRETEKETRTCFSFFLNTFKCKNIIPLKGMNEES